MRLFRYTAIDGRGLEKSGALEAADAREAAGLLRGRGLYPTGIVATFATGSSLTGDLPGATPQRPGVRWLPRFGGAVGTKELAIFTRQLATLLRAGLPLVRALAVLARQQRNAAFRGIIESVAESIKAGATLSEAFGRYPRVFERLDVNLVRAGEAGGALEAALDRLARFKEKTRQLNGRIVAAMMYPVIVLTVAVLILSGLLAFVVPKFDQIFADLLKGAPLPPLTRFVLAASATVRHHAGVAAALGVALGLAWRGIGRTARGAFVFDSLAIRIPVFGDLVLKAIMARFARTFGTLLASGVPMLAALLIARDACGNTRVGRAISGIHDRVKEGAAVAPAVEAAAVFPAMIPGMIEVGEHTGRLPEMLLKVADIYEEEVDNAVAGLGSLIEPILILFLALVVGTMVIALFLPIVRIVQLLT
ncbi:MAG TPA: type II secretion system F family protein [Lacunisphaera sp.]|nr:type II secretion system F family protein [Lacunisphaera sp.]